MKGNLHFFLYLLFSGCMINATASNITVSIRLLHSPSFSPTMGISLSLRPNQAYFFDDAELFSLSLTPGSFPDTTTETSRQCADPSDDPFPDTCLQPTRPPTCMHADVSPRPAGSYPPLSPAHRSSAAIASTPTAVQMPCSEPFLTANSF